MLYPRLFPDFGFGYGQAVFNFYAPLSYVPGALLATLGASPADAAEWTVALGFALAALSAYGMGKYLWGRAGGVLSAVVYTYFPYHLADAYLRGALPEHMAFIFLPIIIWTTVAAFRERYPVPAYLWSALAWAGLVYTHNLTVLLMAPVWVALALMLALTTGKWNRFWGAAGGVALGAALSAPLWMPFLVESKLVGIGLGPSAEGNAKHLAPLGELVQWLPFYRYRVSHGTGVAEHPLSWPALAFALLALGRLVVGTARRRALPGASLAWFGLGLALAAALLTTAATLPVWRLLNPILGQLQYPWRFMSLVALGLTMATGVLGWPLRGKDPAGASHRGARRYAWGGVVIALALVYMVNGLARVPAPPLSLTAAEAWGVDRMWAEDAAAGQVGATWTGEFLPQTVSEQRWALGRALDTARDGAPLSPAPAVRLESRSYKGALLRFDANPPAQVRLHQFYLPIWQAFVDGKRVEAYPSGELGLVTANVPPGAGTLGFSFGPSRPAAAAGVIAALAALAWALTAWTHRWSARRRDQVALSVVAPLLVLLLAAFIANGAGVGVKRWIPQPVKSTVGDVAQLIGYDTNPAKGERGLDVTLYWFALRENAQNHKVFLHLLGPDGQVVAQSDSDPVGGYTPTSRWKPGELIPDTHRLRLPSDLPRERTNCARACTSSAPAKHPPSATCPLRLSPKTVASAWERCKSNDAPTYARGSSRPCGREACRAGGHGARVCAAGPSPWLYGTARRRIAWAPV